MTNVSRTSAVELVTHIKQREISPVEVLDAHLESIRVQNPKFNAIVTLAEDEACLAAKAAESAVLNDEKLGPLHGLPLVIKDVTLTAGIRTTYGSPLYKDFVPVEDAAVVARLRRAGAIILGKTNTPEFATGANTVNALFGATRNPWNPELSPAGSSGGSAVAVASGMVPLAHGTDFGCSVRMPASFCGIVGIRTTGGLIPNEGMRLPWDTGQVHGPLARSAEDAALMLDGMIGLDPFWPTSATPPWQSAFSEVLRTDSAKNLRVAYVSDISGLGVDKDVDDLCRSGALRLEEDGAVVENITFDVSEGIDAYKTLRGQWMVGQQLERMSMMSDFGPNLANNIRDGLRLTVEDVARAESVRERVWKKFREILSRYDFLLTPTAPVTPFPVAQNFPDLIGGKRLENYIDWVASNFLVTLVGFPAGSVPCGKTGAGLPVGLQIIGPRFSEPRILGLSKIVQRRAPVGWPTFAE
jgi:amidase